MESPHDHATPLAFPSPPRRYLATAVDGLAVLAALVLVPYVLTGHAIWWLRFVIALGALLVYEPLCTSRWCTLGQRVMGIRVRSFPELEPISVGKAYFRIIVKLILGWVSFLTIGFSKQRRAIHDMAVSSVVVLVR